MLTSTDILDAERRDDQAQLRRIRDAVRGYPYDHGLGRPYPSPYNNHTSASSASPQYYNSSSNSHLPPVSSITGNMPPGSAYTARMFVSAQCRAYQIANRFIARVIFKDSPFYTVQKQISTTYELKPREQTRDTAKLQVNLDNETASMMSKDQTLRVFVFCAAESYESWKPSDVAFPTHAELKVNQEDIKVNLKGLKSKPGSTRPVDITSFMRKKSGFPNTVELVYALTNKVRLFLFLSPPSRRSSQISRNLLCTYRLHLHRSTSFSSIWFKNVRLVLWSKS